MLVSVYNKLGPDIQILVGAFDTDVDLLIAIRGIY